MSEGGAVSVAAAGRRSRLSSVAEDRSQLSAGEPTGLSGRIHPLGFSCYDDLRSQLTAASSLMAHTVVDPVVRAIVQRNKIAEVRHPPILLSRPCLPSHVAFPDRSLFSVCSPLADDLRLQLRVELE